MKAKRHQDKAQPTLTDTVVVCVVGGSFVVSTTRNAPESCAPLARVFGVSVNGAVSDSIPTKP